MKLEYFCLFLILISCDNSPQNQSPHFKDKNGITTRQDTELYFKNVRQIFYQKRQFSPYENFYTFLKFSEKQPYKLVIWHHWQKSKANVEITGDWSEKNILITQENNPSTKITIDLKKDNAFFVASLQIYQAIIAEKKISLVDKNNKKEDFFITQTDKEAWRVTFKDFLGLVGKDKIN